MNHPSQTFVIRNIAAIVGGNILTFIVFWLMQINLSWLAFNLTHSAWHLGLLGFILNMPILLAIPIGGVYSDRHQRKPIIIASQLLYLIPNFCLFALLYTHQIGYWSMVLIGLCYGAFFGFARPANDALIFDITHNEHQLKIATSVNACASQIAMLITPFLSKWIIAWFKLPSIFILATFINLFAAFIYSRLKPKQNGNKNKDHLLKSLKAGGRYLASQPLLLLFILLVSLTLGVVISLQFQYPALIHQSFQGSKLTLYHFYFFSALGGLTGAIIIIALIRRLNYT
nr:MFS transporter [Gammaproteobacteria bacterium]